MVRQLSVAAVLSLAVTAGSFGADPAVSSVEQAQQMGTEFRPAAETQDAGSDAVPASEGDPDDDSFGSQQILKGVEHIPPFDCFAGISAFVTNNVALTRKDTHSDSFLVATFGFSASRKITDTLTLDLTTEGGVYRYSRYGEFDMDSVDAGVGLSYRMPKLWDATVYAQYGYSDLLDGRTNDEFFENHAFTLGVEKVFPISRALSLAAGVSGDYNFTDPLGLQREDVGGYAGIHAALTSRLEADLYYRYAFEVYTEGSRRDNNQVLTLSVQYTVTNWLSIMGTTYLTINDSNEEVYSYEALAGGVGVNVNIAF